MKVDSAIVRALQLDKSTAKIKAHGGSGFSTTGKLTDVGSDGNEKHYFVKLGPGKESSVMFEGEFASLNAIHNAVPSLCPAAQAFGPAEDSSGSYFLVTDFLEMRGMGSGRKDRPSKVSLAEKLAELHMAPVPIPEGHSRPMFGFPVTTCCGDTPQKNDYDEKWSSFYANNRLLSILEQSEQRNGRDPELRKLVEQTAHMVVPRLLDESHLNGGAGARVSLVHGDLWSGNRSSAVFAGTEQIEDVIFDPSCCYAHSEYELGIMRMFGGFDRTFLASYHKICPKSQPIEEYDDRVSLYELYHHLNHYTIFRGGYRGGAVAIMRKLVGKYTS